MSYGVQLAFQASGASWVFYLLKGSANKKVIEPVISRRIVRGKVIEGEN